MPVDSRCFIGVSMALKASLFRRTVSGPGETIDVIAAF